MWSGFAFENLCHIHIDAIKSIRNKWCTNLYTIGVLKVMKHFWCTNRLTFLEHTNGSKNIDIIECKYYDEEFVIDKSYMKNLKEK